MSFSAGSRLGPYEILSQSGKGGMGQIYKARDTRLNRFVAIKVVPDNFSQSHELRARFEREAQTLASLSHPHICPIFDIGEQDGTDFIVMEFLEGHTLAQRLEKGALPLDEALKIAIETADALDKAHQQGVIHRDVKPSNVMLTKSGAKLLDFGLAKLKQASESMTLSAVPTQDVTAEGTILGTLQYMSPEQLEGKEADSRTDIFGFGTTLYEAITGKKAFEGKSQASLISAIMSSDPPAMSRLQSMTPHALDRVVKKCLAKEPERRWQSASDLTDELRWIAEGTMPAANPTTPVPQRRNRERVAWSLFVITALALLGFVLNRFHADREEATPVEFAISAPDKTQFGPVGSSAYSASPYPVVSPNGRHIAFLAATGGFSARIWVRSIDSLESRVLPGTDGAFLPFWSPDSRYIGFFAGGKLNKVEFSGGPIQVLCDAPAAEGGTWNREGVILFAPNSGAGGLHRVSAAGGQSTVITSPAREGPHVWPYFLPDGRHFVYLGQANNGRPNPPPNMIYMASLDSKETKRLLNADSRAIYAAPGYLLFLRQGTLMGQSLNTKTLEVAGEPFRIAENVRSNILNAHAAFSVSDTGLLVYRAGEGTGAHVVWFDRGGRQLEPINQTGDSRQPRLSPDETRIAVERQDGRQSDIWVIDLARGTNSRLTLNPRNETAPIWSPDGTSIVYAAEASGKRQLYRKLASGSGTEELILDSDQDSVPTSWSRDGKFLLFQSRSETNASYRIWILPMMSGSKPFPFLQTPSAGTAPQFSPDGKWIAYWNSESGTSQTYVQSFPATGDKVQVSVDGGIQPIWRNDGKELFFMSPDNRLMAVDVELGSKFRAGIPKPLFSIPGYAPGAALRYSVSRDGQRFLMSIGDALADTPITAILNWKPRG